MPCVTQVSTISACTFAAINGRSTKPSMRSLSTFFRFSIHSRPTRGCRPWRPSMPDTSDSLFQPYALGSLELPNRIVMPPMTRSRASQPGDIPNALMAEYYAQRASAGLIISEGTWISPLGKGYAWTPGIHTPAQVAGWRKITQAVHDAGGRIFAQLWHVGRLSHISLLDGQAPVSSSAMQA